MKLVVTSEWMNFSQALDKLKTHQKVSRVDWNYKKFVVFQKGYLEGINCNKQTAEAWGIEEGSLFIVRPYLQIQNEDSSHSMYNPTNDDLFADDWITIETSK